MIHRGVTCPRRRAETGDLSGFSRVSWHFNVPTLGWEAMALWAWLLLAGPGCRGVVVRRADFNDQASLPEAFAGADKLLLVSGSEAGQRVRQHGNAINAAKAAGVRFIAYTSGVRANTSTLLAVQDHRATEGLLAEAGVPHARLRNCWYLENYTGQLPGYLERGIVGAAGAGKVSAATRADYAEAAAAVLAGQGHAGAVYELGGEPFTMAELAEVISAATGRTVTYTDLPPEQYQAVLVGAGLPEEMGLL
jgi:NAD(P)H dehydrogenase (quinone)